MGIRKEQSSKLSVIYLGSSESNADERINLPAYFSRMLVSIEVDQARSTFRVLPGNQDDR
jgi:hypothetical protein